MSDLTTILLVDPDATRRRALAHRLYGVCDRVIEVAAAEVALHDCHIHAVDLVVAAAHLPGRGAEALCAELRGRGGPPVIAFRLGADPEAHLRWFDSGGADCLSGDDPVLVAARCRAVLRRAGPPRPGTPRTPSPRHHHVDDALDLDR